MQNSSWHKLEQGQALLEYGVLIPAAIMIMVSASLIGVFLKDSFREATDILEIPHTCELEEDNNTNSGPTTAELGDHSITLTSSVYNPSDDTTTITYYVESGDQPSISHWVLGLPDNVYGNIISISEQSEWTNSDPTTGTQGIKFDTGYEGSGESGGNNGNNDDRQNGNNGVGNGDDPQPPGNPPVNDGEGTSPGNPGNNGGNNGNNNGGRGGNRGKIMVVRISGVQSSQYDMDDYDGVARTVTLLVSGQYEFAGAEVSIKAGQETNYGTISMPVRVIHTTDANCDN